MAERSRTIRWEDPATMPSRGADLSGLEVLRRIADGTFAPSPMTQLMGFTILEVSPGRVVFAATPAEYHYNPSGVVHGGFAATLLDSAMGCAVYSTAGAGLHCPTLELKVNLVRAITLATGTVRAVGTVLHRGRTTALAEGRIEDRDGRLLAHATTTCLFVPARASQPGAGADG
jgi:uncharacterized protein (TIGR00369 family)